MTDEEIKSDYGEIKKWPMFSELKEKVHNGGMWQYMRIFSAKFLFNYNFD